MRRAFCVTFFRAAQYFDSSLMRYPEPQSRKTFGLNAAPTHSWVLPLFAAVLWGQGLDTVFEGTMTSSGKNRPSISLTKDLINLCAFLHRRLPPSEITAHLQISEEQLQLKLDLLLSEGLAKTISQDKIVPTAVVVTLEDARTYFHPDDRIVESAARLMLRKLPEVKAECQRIKSLAGVPFESISFFVVGDVLLDNWQISNVERLFVKADRTQRTGGRYYFTILEKPVTQTAEPFGIYGNTGSQWGSVQIGLYGNDRFSGHTLLSIRDADFNNRFGFDPLLNPKDARQQLAEHIVEALRNKSTSLTQAQRESLSQLGLIQGNRLNVLLLKGDDYKALDQVAAVVTRDLIQFLELQRAAIAAAYRSSPYAEETSFNEYFMCWYHFFYTAVTNRLRDQGAVSIPANGTATYFMVP